LAKYYHFISSQLSLSEKRVLAINHLDYLNTILEPLVFIKREIPKYIRMHKKVGYFVKHPEIKTKYFISSVLSLEENLNNAKIYLNTNLTGKGSTTKC
jgi:hypothetical protein